ncbi:hypothetical protein ECG_06147 [Echinococcus granulosus]|nr:hypothetical protein ECG_06147 [Echinococcus granulosus]
MPTDHEVISIKLQWLYEEFARKHQCIQICVQLCFPHKRMPQQLVMGLFECACSVACRPLRLLATAPRVTDTGPGRTSQTLSQLAGGARALSVLTIRISTPAIYYHPISSIALHYCTFAVVQSNVCLSFISATNAHTAS